MDVRCTCSRCTKPSPLALPAQGAAGAPLVAARAQAATVEGVKDVIDHVGQLLRLVQRRQPQPSTHPGSLPAKAVRPDGTVRHSMSDVLRIPAVSHLPAFDAVVATTKWTAYRLAVIASALCVLGAGIVTWDMYGSSLYTGHAQSKLSTQLAEAPPVLAAPAAVTAAPVAPADPAAPFAPLPQPASQILIDTTTLQDSQPVGRIIIDKIGVDATFVYGTGEQQLALGPGLWKWGVLPGEPGNAMISGHRTTYSAPFHDIDQLVPGDRITVQIPGRHDAVFEVRGTQVVTPDNMTVSEQTDGVRLTLTACHPKGSAKQRIIVQAELVAGDNLAYAWPASAWAFHS